MDEVLQEVIKYHSDIRLETAEKCSRISRSPIRNEGEELPEHYITIEKMKRVAEVVARGNKTAQIQEHPPPSCLVRQRNKNTFFLSRTITERKRSHFAIVLY